MHTCAYAMHSPLCAVHIHAIYVYYYLLVIVHGAMNSGDSRKRAAHTHCVCVEIVRTFYYLRYFFLCGLGPGLTCPGLPARRLSAGVLVLGVFFEGAFPRPLFAMLEIVRRPGTQKAPAGSGGLAGAA